MPSPRLQRFANLTLPVAAGLSFMPPLLTRLVIGSAFHFTGAGKRHNLDRTTQFFASLGIPFPHFNAIFIAGLEFVGGLGIFFGLATRIFGALLSCSMTVALIIRMAGSGSKTSRQTSPTSPHSPTCYS